MSTVLYGTQPNTIGSIKPKVYNISQNTSPKKSQTNQQQVSNTENQGPPFFVATSGLLAILVIVLIIYDRVQVKKLQKKLKFEKFRSREFEKKLKLSLQTIRKMETNPDLINSRDFNLDYLRMRMAEEVFNFAVLNQVKIKIKDKITVALRPNPDQQVVVGIANNSGRKIDEIFDVEYDTGVSANGKRVLFRIQICLTKLPTQSTSNTINQLINCIEKYLGPAEDHDTWQPTIQGRIAYMHWDQKAKPTPLLVLEQVDEGVNVSFRTSRAAKGKV